MFQTGGYVPHARLHQFFVMCVQKCREHMNANGCRRILPVQKLLTDPGSILEKMCNKGKVHIFDEGGPRNLCCERNRGKIGTRWGKRVLARG